MIKIPLFVEYWVMNNFENINIFEDLDSKSIAERQKNLLHTDHNKIFGFMFYLIRNYLNLNQTEMGMVFGQTIHDKYNNKGISKSAYSKIENGETSMNFELLIILSSIFGVDFKFFTDFYRYLMEFFYNKNSIFLKPCATFGFGKNSGYTRNMKMSEDSMYTKLKDYNKFIAKSDFDNFYDILNNHLAIMKQGVQFNISLGLYNKDGCL